MLSKPTGRGRATLAMTGLLVSLPAWAFHWPWHHAGSPATQAVQVVNIALDPLQASAGARLGAAPMPQYWDRNTLLLDMTRVAGEGGATLTPNPDAGGWPVRLEFRVRPGSITELEVQGSARAIFFVPARGTAVILRLDPGLYSADTARIKLHWSAAEDSAH